VGNDVTTRPRAVVQHELEEARTRLRDAESTRDRAVKVADRWDANVRYLWVALWLGLVLLAIGFLAVYVNDLTPLSLGGTIGAQFTVGGVMTIGAALAIPTAITTDSMYRKTSVGRYGDDSVNQSRREVADALTDGAERELNRVTELLVELQETEEPV
jgi:hypothetical protein